MPRRVLSAPKANFGARLRARSGFIAAVYAALAVQLAITAALSAYFRKNPAVYERLSKLWILWLILNIAILLALAFLPLPFAVKALLFAAFAVVLSFTFVAADKRVSPETIRAALAATVGIFVAMTAVGLGLAAIGVDLAFLSYVLLAALVGLIVTYAVIYFFPVGKTAMKAILLVAMTIFAVFVAYDTNALLAPGAPTGPSAVLDAAIGFYLDIVNLFSEAAAYTDLSE